MVRLPLSHRAAGPWPRSGAGRVRRRRVAAARRTRPPSSPGSPGRPCPARAPRSPGPGRDRSSSRCAFGPAAVAPDPLQLHAQDGVRPVVSRITVVTSRFSRAIVHSAWIVYSALPSDSRHEHRPVRARDRRADRHRQALADRAAGQASASRAAARPRSPSAANSPDVLRLVDDDRALGQQRADAPAPTSARSARPLGSSGRRRGCAARGSASAATSVGDRVPARARRRADGRASTCTSQPSGTRSLALPG